MQHPNYGGLSRSDICGLCGLEIYHEECGELLLKSSLYMIVLNSDKTMKEIEAESADAKREDETVWQDERVR